MPPKAKFVNHDKVKAEKVPKVKKVKAEVKAEVKTEVKADESDSDDDIICLPPPKKSKSKKVSKNSPKSEKTKRPLNLYQKFCQKHFKLMLNVPSKDRMKTVAELWQKEKNKGTVTM